MFKKQTSVVKIFWDNENINKLADPVKKTEIKRDKRFANHNAPCTAIWQEPLQSVLALRSFSATDLNISASWLLFYDTDSRLALR